MINPGEYIKDLLQLPVGSKAIARGWVKTKTEFPEHFFVKLGDGSTSNDLQLIVRKTVASESVMAQVTTGACLSAEGEIVASSGKEQATDLDVSSLTLHGAADPETYYLQKKRMNLETLRPIAHFRPRTNTLSAVFRVRNTAAYAIHRFFQERGFMYVHTPVITTSDAEGAGQMFQVTTLDLERCKGGPVDYTNDFFGQKTALTVSGQLEAEIFALAFANVYTFGPTFRAENSNTTRHLSEFWMIEPEMAFCDLAGNMSLAQEFLKFIISEVLRLNRPELEFFQKWYEDKTLIATLEHVASSDFAHCTYTDAVTQLEKSGKTWQFPVAWGTDLQSEHERYLTETIYKKPVIVTDYPADIKAFYMRRNDDNRTVRAMDVLVPKVGEIIGGSQREERYDILSERVAEHCKIHHADPKSYQWYLELRKYGGVEHAGFGLGFERILMYMTGMTNIRDVIPFPRFPGSAAF